MYRERAILHFNVADFAVAVERVADTSLRRRPLIIAPPAARAVVYDMSEEAYQVGVRKGMVLNQASRLCREAAVVQPRVELYRRATAAFLKRLQRYSPLIEHGAEDGHFFVDLTGTHRLLGPPPDVGLRVRREVRDDLGINPIWALAANKLVAKVSSRLVKPVGEYIVGAGEEEPFLAPLAVELLPGVLPRELRQLQEFRIFTVGQLAALSTRQLLVLFGSRSSYLHAASRGQDTTRIEAGLRHGLPVDGEQLFTPDTNDRQQVIAALAVLVARAGEELRRRGQVARRVGIWLRYSDGGHIVRQASVREGTASDFALRQLAAGALQRAWLRRTRLRSLRLVCDRLHRQSPQLPLFPLPGAPVARQQRLLGAMDAIRGRFGTTSIFMGSPGVDEPTAAVLQ